MKSKQILEFKETEIGKIPVDWEVKKISELCIGIFDGPHATPKKTETGPFFLGITCLENGRIDFFKSAHLSEKDFKRWTKRVTPQFEDIVFSYETRLGQVGKIPKNVRCCLGRRLALMRPNKKIIDPNFLLYYYVSPNFQNYIKQNSVQGSTVDRILLTEFPNFKIPLPSLDSQRIIGKYINDLDSKIQNLQDQNKILEQIAHTIFKSWFIDFDGVTEFNDSELGRIPKGWNVVKLGELIIRNKNKITEKQDWADENIIDLSNMPKFSICLDTFEKGESFDTNIFRLNKMDILFGSIRPYFGKSGFSPINGVVTGSILSYIPKNKNHYAFALLATTNKKFINSIAQLSRGTKMPIISWADFCSYKITIPKNEEILKKINSFITPILEKIVFNIQEIQIQSSTRNSLLPKLMSGEIRV